MQKVSIAASYIEKQRNFRALVKDIQFSLTSKDYKQKGYSFNNYIKMRWNISQAQAYRYLMCAKVLDQLEEFEIQPSYERICNALYHTVKTPAQMKLLWSVIIQKAGNVPESINSTHIKKIWKEICMNDKYSYITNNNININKKAENALSKFSIEKKQKQLSHMKPVQAAQTMNTSTVIPFSKIPSPVLSETSAVKNTENIENTLPPTVNNIYSSVNNVNVPLSPKTNFACNSITFDDASSMSCSSYQSIVFPTTNSSDNLYYMMAPNEIQYQQQPNEIQYQPQVFYYY